MNLVDIVDHIEEALSASGYTNVMQGILGRGSYPDTVVVPTNLRSLPGEVYVTIERNNSKQVFKAINDCPAIPLDNSIAGYPIIVAYPPNSETLTVVSPAPLTAALFTGGALPSHIAQVNLAIQDPARNPNLLITETNPASMSINCVGGWFRLGDRPFYVPPLTAFVNMITYKPAGINQARFCVITITGDRAGKVYAGIVFDETTVDPNLISDYIPTPHAVQEVFVAIIYIKNSSTVLTRANGAIRPLHTLPTVPDPGAGIYIQSVDPGAAGAKSIWIDTSGGNGNWIIKVRNLANTAWETIAAADPTAGFDRIVTNEDGNVVVGEDGNIVVGEL